MVGIQFSFLPSLCPDVCTHVEIGIERKRLAAGDTQDCLRQAGLEHADAGGCNEQA